MRYGATDKENGTETPPILTGVGCFALGAAVMYFLDPDRGARRRGIVRDKVFSGARQAGEAAVKTAEYSRDRSRGVFAETVAKFRPDDAGDENRRQRNRPPHARPAEPPRDTSVPPRAALPGPASGSSAVAPLAVGL
jgi:hypothetical protein